MGRKSYASSSASRAVIVIAGLSSTLSGRTSGDADVTEKRVMTRARPERILESAGMMIMCGYEEIMDSEMMSCEFA